MPTKVYAQIAPHLRTIYKRLSSKDLLSRCLLSTKCINAAPLHMETLIKFHENEEFSDLINKIHDGPNNKRNN